MTTRRLLPGLLWLWVVAVLFGYVWSFRGLFGPILAKLGWA